MNRLVSGRELAAALCDRGIVPPNTRRIVIDIQADGAAIVYWEVFADEVLLDILRNPGVEIRGV